MQHLMEHSRAVQDLLQLTQRVSGPRQLGAARLVPRTAAPAAARLHSVPCRLTRAPIAAAVSRRTVAQLLLQRGVQARERLRERSGGPAGCLGSAAVSCAPECDAAACDVGCGAQGSVPRGLQLCAEPLDSCL